MVRDFDGHCNSFVFSSSRGVHRAHFKFKNKTPSHNGFECFILLFELRMAPRNGPTRILTDHHHRSSILVRLGLACGEITYETYRKSSVESRNYDTMSLSRAQ